ncbi:MAG: cupredoxin family copper-binding protein [Pyrinomonadaceae bacterium]
MKRNNLRTLAIAILIGSITIYAFLALTGISGRSVEAASAKTHVVAIRNSEFSPATITVAAGDTVVFRNYDIVPHTATGRTFDSGNLDKGQSWRYVAKKKGSFAYICTYHPSMKGRVVVK